MVLPGNPDATDQERQENMESERSGVTRIRGGLPWSPVSWRASFILGVITLILGVILAFRPTQSLVAIAVLLGVVMIVSGIYHIVRALSGREHQRVWRGISGMVFILIGLVLLRHLHLSVALIGLFIGFTWVIQGIAALVETFSGGGRVETGWSVFFGIISLIAGIVVISAPIASVSTLTIFMGAWFIVMGIMEMIGAFAARNAAPITEDAGGVSVPQQRATEAGVGKGATSTDVAGQAAAGGARPESRNIPG